MMTRLRRHALAATSMLFLASGVAKADLLTFDNITTGQYLQIPDGYGGLNWSNFYALNATTLLNNIGPSGYSNGLVSPSSVAFNAGGQPAVIAAQAGTFTLNSGYFTAAWNDGLNIEVQGYQGTTLAYDVNFTVDTSGPTLETLDFLDVSSVTIISSGGTNHGYGGSGTQFVLDNLTINGPVASVPVPASLMLTSLGALTISGFHRLRRRRTGQSNEAAR